MNQMDYFRTEFYSHIFEYDCILPARPRVKNVLIAFLPLTNFDCRFSILEHRCCACLISHSRTALGEQYIQAGGDMEALSARRSTL